MSEQKYTPTLDVGNLHNLVKFVVDGSEEALQQVLKLVISIKPKKWEGSHSDLLDTLYRTRFRQLLSQYFPLSSMEELVTFAQHLNLASSIMAIRDRSLAAKIKVYEDLMNDAIDELEAIQEGRTTKFEANTPK